MAAAEKVGQVPVGKGQGNAQRKQTQEQQSQEGKRRPEWFGRLLDGAITLLKSFGKKSTWLAFGAKALAWAKLAMIVHTALWLFKDLFPFRIALRDE